MRNNIFEGSLYAFYAYNSDAFGDYNLYYSTGTYLGYHYVSSPYALTQVDSIGELQSLDTTMHMSSIEGDPIFAGPGDLHVFGPLANVREKCPGCAHFSNEVATGFLSTTTLTFFASNSFELTFIFTLLF